MDDEGKRMKRTRTHLQYTRMAMRTMRPRTARLDTIAKGRMPVLSLSLTDPTLDSWLLLLISDEEEGDKVKDMDKHFCCCPLFRHIQPQSIA